MSRELIVQSKASHVELALMEKNRLVEFHQEKNDNKLNVGDVFLSKITKLTPGLNATFVNIGHKKEGFLHYSDLGPKVLSQINLLDQLQTNPDFSFDEYDKLPEIDKNGKINEVLKRGLPILVQITKEPISTKGPRLTSEITLAGRYAVLVPLNDQISISRKIKEPNERKRLSDIFSKYGAKNYGFIVRTAAEGQKTEDLERDIMALKEKWVKILDTVAGSKAPSKIYTELNKSFSILRDLLSSDFNKVVCDNSLIAAEISDYIAVIAPEKKKMVEHYKGKKPVFDQFQVTRQMKSLFGKTVNLSNGAYLVIEHTEAMNVIDVNSGNKVNADADQEKNSLQVNLMAAEEIARQLRLRDIGGIIIIDFIDMKKSENKKLVLQTMRDSMTLDRSKHTILSITKFGLMQITRQRVKPLVHIETTETCPTCKGAGEIDSPLLVLDEIEDDLDYLLTELNYQKIKIITHPFIEAYLKKGLWKSQQWQWFFKYKKWSEIHSDLSLHLTQYKFFGGDDGSEIELK